MTDKPTIIEVNIESRELSLDLSKQDADNILKALLLRIGRRVKITLTGFESVSLNGEEMGDSKK